jgi:hypothetical protein
VDTTWPDPVTVTFEAGDYSRTFSLDELASLDEVVEFDNGTAIAFHGIQFFRKACPRGMLAGFWGLNDEGEGEFKGMWFSGFGRLGGFLMGSYGVDDQGRKVYYGKWIDRSGAFEGLLKGRYDYFPGSSTGDMARHRAGGWFAGRIFDADGGEIGVMGGVYRSSPFIQGGWFQGRWRLNCFAPPEGGMEVRPDGL